MATCVPSKGVSTVPQLRALTGLRGLAAWWVVLHHFREVLPGGTPGFVRAFGTAGYLAVDLFFVLSGFVIAMNYADRFAHSFRGSLTFLGLRLARIYPLHLFMLLVFLANPIALTLFSSAGPDHYRYGAEYWFLSLFLVQNWGITDHLQWNAPAWSISTEWFAYLVFPGLAWVTTRVARTAVGSAGWIVALLSTLCVSTMMTATWLGQDVPGFGLLRCLLEFGAGMCLFRLHAAVPGRGIGVTNLAAVASVMLFGAHAVLPVADYVVMPLGFACLIFALADQRGVPSRLLSSRVLGWLGAISYSTYLVHYFVRDWVKFLLLRPGVPDVVPLVAYFGAVFAASVVLYYAVEQPGQRVGRAMVKHLGRGARGRAAPLGPAVASTEG